MSRLRHFYDALNDGISPDDREPQDSPEATTRSAARREAQPASAGGGSQANVSAALYATEDSDSPKLADFGVPVEAVIDRTVRATPHAADTVTVEHYRRLRTKLLQEQEAKPFRTLMIASPNPREGKSLTALNLALSFSMLPSFRVLIVDADLRKGSLGKWLGVEGRPGFSNLIEGTAELGDVILQSGKIPARFMVSGDSPVAPAELLNSPRAQESFQRMARHFDLVIVDSPPLALVTDAHLLAQRCDAILLVARAFSTAQKAFEKAAHDLAPYRLLGAVLNGGASTKRYRRYEGYY